MLLFSSFTGRWLLVIAGSAAITGLAVWVMTGVSGLSIAAAVFAIAAMLELLSSTLARRRNRLAKLWPQVFDSCYSAQAAGLSLDQQLTELAMHGPEQLRSGFAALQANIDNTSLTQGLLIFQQREASRESDLFVTLVSLDLELGGRGLRSAWRDAGRHLRESIKLGSEIATRQGWVVGSAKLALGAPWLIAAVLMQLGDNRAIFASALGTAVLLFGLGLSALGFFLVNLLGRLPEFPRVLYAN